MTKKKQNVKEKMTKEMYDMYVEMAILCTNKHDIIEGQINDLKNRVSILNAEIEKLEQEKNIINKIFEHHNLGKIIMDGYSRN